MKVKKVILKNFRAYREKIVIDIDDLTVFIGKNDVGKSTILEALDIFFNDGKGSIKVEKDDLNKQAKRNGENDFLIGVVFSDLPTNIVIDSNVPVTLKDEYLLNEDGDLEIHKIFKNGKMHTYIFAKHPSNDDILKNLLSKKISELRKFVNDHNLECANKSVASSLRQSIRNSYSELVFENLLIPTDKEEAKQIWLKIQKYLPVYALFQSDRTNKDQDNEVQDPLKFAIREILKRSEIQEKLVEVAQKVEEISTKIAKSTLEKLRELNANIAKQLKPNIPKAEDLKWADVFKKIAISSDDDIPLNKRGSGVRRLVLLSFFGAEVERRKLEKDAVNVIYAIEEPETSQHPEHQRLLIKNFIKLSESNNTQIILTTHSPSIAQLLPIESLRLIKKETDKVVVKKGDESIILEIADTLGVLPTLSKIVVCVEGENDRDFLLNINQNISELREIVDLKSKNISIIPMQGSKLKQWVERHYLKNSNVIEYYLCDKDASEQYKKEVEKINSRPDPSYGTLTKKREMENYIHKSLIEEEFEIEINDISDWDNEDIPKYLSKKTGKTEVVIKRILNGNLSRKMTKDLFEDLGAWDEVCSWFEKIKELLSRTLNKEGAENVQTTG